MKNTIMVTFVLLLFGCTTTEQATIEMDTEPDMKEGPLVEAEPPKKEPDEPEPPKAEDKSEESEEYSVDINPSDFSSDLTNKYFNMPVGKKLVYEGVVEEGIERIEVNSMDDTRLVMGVRARVIWDRVWLNDELIEDTKDWYAQDKDGNIWYFGEDTAEYIDGKIVNHAGAWESGVDGALPGILFPAEPKVGDFFHQEYYEGIAEDQMEILALDESVTVPYGELDGCVKVREFTPLEPGVNEHKYDCPEVGFTVLEVALEDGERVELISVEYDAEPTPVEIEDPEELVPEMSEERAKELALAEVPGKVTDIEIERKFGILAYVVEVDPDSGPETDVIIDMETGEVLGTET